MAIVLGNDPPMDLILVVSTNEYDDTYSPRIFSDYADA
jgi:hypothetical protein